jgi:hypothetical protein
MTAAKQRGVHRLRVRVEQAGGREAAATLVVSQREALLGARRKRNRNDAYCLVSYTAYSGRLVQALLPVVHIHGLTPATAIFPL